MKKTYYLPEGGAQYAPYLIDMIEGNHTLIAGTTGAGKSVLENSIIYALLSARFPGATSDGRGARFVLIDPKRVELYMYKDLPHTLFYADTIPAIVDVLRTVRVMIDERVQRMQKTGQKKSTECAVYVFIDELVDLVKSQQSKEIVRLIADSISIARAANIYFVILTQAPNRKILLPEIVLNCNCRIALRCNNAIESRQIIGDDSAVSLPLHGVGIVQQNLDRYNITIPYYSDSQLLETVKHWEKQHKFSNRLFRAFHL